MHKETDFATIGMQSFFDSVKRYVTYAEKNEEWRSTHSTDKIGYKMHFTSKWN